MYRYLKPIFVLIMCVFGTAGHALDLDSMSEQEKRLFGEQVREYLLQNPETIMDVFAVLEQQQKLAEQQQDDTLIATFNDEILNDGYSWIGGNPNGDITLVEFIDYKCVYCRRAHNEVADLVKTDGNIKLIVKEYPILGEDSYRLSRAAVATLQSLGSDAYKKMYNEFIKHDGPVTDDAILYLAKKVGLKGPAIIDQLQQPSVDEQIQKTRLLGENLNIAGTPAFIINDQFIRGYIPADTMKEVVAQLRAHTQ